MTRLCDVLGIERGITAFVGSGGKTSLINRLAAELCADNNVLCATTTRIYPPADGVTLLNPSTEMLTDAYRRIRLVTAGEMCEDGKLCAPRTDLRALAAVADYTLTEADGSRGLPLKAPNDNEPVLTGGERLVIAVLGATGLLMPIDEAAHRPILYAALLNKKCSDIAEPSDAAAALMKAYGHIAPCRFMTVINQCDDEALTAPARACAIALRCDCALVSLKKRPDWYELYGNGERLV